MASPTLFAFLTMSFAHTNSCTVISRMGSYLSIHNNTDDIWQVKVGTDEAAIKIFGLITVAVTVTAAAITSAGAAAPLATSLAANGVVSICGLSTSALAAVCSAAAAVSGVAIAATATGWAKAMVVLIHEHLQKEGYHTLAPGKAFVCSQQQVNEYSIDHMVLLMSHCFYTVSILCTAHCRFEML